MTTQRNITDLTANTFQTPAKGNTTMTTNTSTESAAASQLENLSLETKIAKELREILLVFRAASIPEDKVCAFLDRYCNGRKMYEN